MVPGQRWNFCHAAHRHQDAIGHNRASSTLLLRVCGLYRIAMVQLYPLWGWANILPKNYHSNYQRGNKMATRQGQATGCPLN